MDGFAVANFEDRDSRAVCECLLGIQFPNPIAPEVAVEEIKEIREEEPRGYAVDAAHEQEKKRKSNDPVRQPEQIGVAEISSTEEEVIPKRVNEQNRADQDEC